MEIGTTKNYFYLLKISASVCVYLKYIYDILKNDMGDSSENNEEMSVGSGRQQRWPHQKQEKISSLNMHTVCSPDSLCFAPANSHNGLEKSKTDFFSTVRRNKPLASFIFQEIPKSASAKIKKYYPDSEQTK